MSEIAFESANRASTRCLEQRFKARMDAATAMARALSELGSAHQVGLLVERDERLPDHAKSFFAELWSELVEHDGVTHPFLDRFAKASLSLEQVQTFGKHYYRHAKMFLHYLGYVIPAMPVEQSQLILMENLVDEYGSFDPSWVHPAVYRSFLAAVGLEPVDWEELEPLPEVALYIDRHLYMCRYGDPLTACGALALGTEWFVPMMFSKIVAGLIRVEGITDEVLTYWKAHITLDVLHSHEAMRALAPFTADRGARIKIRAGALRSLDARKVLWDGMSRVTFAAAP